MFHEKLLSLKSLVKWLFVNGCGKVGWTAASESKDHRFDSRHHQFRIRNMEINIKALLVKTGPGFKPRTFSSSEFKSFNLKETASVFSYHLHLNES